MKRQLVLASTVITLLLFAACNRGPKQELQDEGSSLDRVAQGPRLAPQRVTHGLSKLDKSQKFTFEVPPHALTPRLQGNFTSFVQGKDGARISDEDADVELLVMTEEQYDAFTNRRSAESLYAIEPSHDHGVSIALPPTQETGSHYYAVFRRTTDAKSPIFVNADLSVEFAASP
jgi:hypothetical protein